MRPDRVKTRSIAAKLFFAFALVASAFTPPAAGVVEEHETVSWECLREHCHRERRTLHDAATSKHRRHCPIVANNSRRNRSRHGIATLPSVGEHAQRNGIGCPLLI